MAKRPPVPYPASRGQRWEAVPDDSFYWRVEPRRTQRRCRQPACGVKAVVAMLRGRLGTNGYLWGCCNRHMYGRWVEAGKVWYWRQVEACSCHGDRHGSRGISSDIMGYSAAPLACALFAAAPGSDRCAVCHHLDSCHLKGNP